MTEVPNLEETGQAGFTSEVFHYTPQDWEKVRDDILELSRYAQGQRVISTDNIKEWCERYFKNTHPDIVTVLLKKDKKVIGFSLAHRTYSYSDDEKDYVPSLTKAEIDTNVIAPEHQGRGYVGLLTNGMEDELKRRGFKEFVIVARTGAGYADAIVRHYKDRITYDSYMNPGDRYFAINL